MPRKKITWLPGKGPALDFKRPPVYTPDAPLPTHGPVKQALTTGSLWVTKLDTYVQSELRTTTPHPIPYVGHMLAWSDARIPCGTFSIYMGTTRVEELDTRTRRKMSVLRHTFLINGQPFMTRDVAGWFIPLEIAVENV